MIAVKEELEMCEYLASEASLTLLHEYHCRVGVLRDLQYVDTSSVVSSRAGWAVRWAATSSSSLEEEKVA